MTRTNFTTNSTPSTQVQRRTRTTPISSPTIPKTKKTPRVRPTTKAQRVKRMNKIEGITKQVKKEQEQFFKVHPKEAEFWKARSSFGRRPIFKSPDDLFKACMEYIQWVHDNPYYEYKVVGTHFGEAIIEHIPKKRPLTIGSLVLFLDISIVAWMQYAKERGDDFIYICKVVDEMIRQQKFGGAAAGFFNHAIIARDLGLVERQDVTSGDKPIERTVIVLPAKEVI
jgi:hypothetical protein